VVSRRQGKEEPERGAIPFALGTTYPLEYVSGAILAENGEVFVTIANVGDTEESARVLGFQEDQATPIYDSDQNWPQRNPLPPKSWWYYELTAEQGKAYWFIVWTTSPDLAPSIHFTKARPNPASIADIDEPVTYAWIQPGDFALLHRRVRLTPGIELPEGPLSNS
jgi:hypothetical protein